MLLEHVSSTYWRTVDLHYERTLPIRAITCPLCAHTGDRDSYQHHVSECRFNGGRLERYACPACDILFGPLKMLDLTESQLAMEYRALYSRYREADSTEAEIRAFHACQPRPGGLYLNWGCGAWSQTIEQLREEGWDVWATSRSPNQPARSSSTTAARCRLDSTGSSPTT